MARLTPIRLALLEEDRTQKSLADEVGLTESRMSLIVNGLVPDVETREAIAAALRRPLAVLWPDLHDAQPDGDVTGSDAGHRKAA